MRGLTSDEYLLLRHISDPPLRDATFDETIVARQLMVNGRVALTVCRCSAPVHLRAGITPAGREAMRLHEFLAARGAL
jgi:hypothetical protein